MPRAGYVMLSKGLWGTGVVAIGIPTFPPGTVSEDAIYLPPSEE